MYSSAPGIGTPCSITATGRDHVRRSRTRALAYVLVRQPLTQATRREHPTHTFVTHSPREREELRILLILHWIIIVRHPRRQRPGSGGRLASRPAGRWNPRGCSGSLDVGGHGLYRPAVFTFLPSWSGRMEWHPHTAGSVSGFVRAVTGGHGSNRFGSVHLYSFPS